MDSDVLEFPIFLTLKNFLFFPLPSAPNSKFSSSSPKKKHVTHFPLDMISDVRVHMPTWRKLCTIQTHLIRHDGWICNSRKTHFHSHHIHTIHDSHFLCQKKCNQVRVVFLYWLPMILRMHRPGSDNTMNYPPTPTSDASERKTTNIQDVELRERYEREALFEDYWIGFKFFHFDFAIREVNTVQHS